MVRREIQCISTDPGLVNHGICRLAFYGFEYKQNDENEWIKIPQFDILHWELIDLKRGISYSYNHEKNCITRAYFGTNKNTVATEDFLVIADNLTKFISSKDWLYEEYHSTFFNQGETPVLPSIVTELQAGHVMNKEKGNDASSKWDVVMVSHILPWAIRTVDQRNGKQRELISKGRKYGIPSDGTLTYAQRKAKADEVCRELLKLTGKQKELNFLSALKAARKRDIPNKTPQSHDTAESMLLGLEWCQNKYEELENQMMMNDHNEVWFKQCKRLEITIEDDDEPKMINIIDLSEKMNKAFERMDKAKKKRKRDLYDEDEKPIKKPRKKRDNAKDAFTVKSKSKKKAVKNSSVKYKPLELMSMTNK